MTGIGGRRQGLRNVEEPGIFRGPMVRFHPDQSLQTECTYVRGQNDDNYGKDNRGPRSVLFLFAEHSVASGNCGLAILRLTKNKP